MNLPLVAVGDGPMYSALAVHVLAGIGFASNGAACCPTGCGEVSAGQPLGGNVKAAVKLVVLLVIPRLARSSPWHRIGASNRPTAAASDFPGGPPGPGSRVTNLYAVFWTGVATRV